MTQCEVKQQLDQVKKLAIETQYPVVGSFKDGAENRQMSFACCSNITSKSTRTRNSWLPFASLKYSSEQVLSLLTGRYAVLG
jgi:hypothetical protein